MWTQAAVDPEHTFYYNQPGMFLLPSRIRSLLESQGKVDSRRFSLDADLVTALRQAAREQGCSEQEVLAGLVESRQELMLRDRAAAACWDSLSEREREVLALVCLGQRNYEIARVLGITHETVKTHLQHIFRKFSLRSKKELRLLLKDWDFIDWWEDSHQAAGPP